MKRKHKSYSKPKRPFDKERFAEEEKIMKEFGLKNKREIWKAEGKVKLIREKAKRSISSSNEEQKILFDKLRKIGLDVNSIADALSLDKRDYLKRRLQMVVLSKKLANTAKSARQLITHKKILVDGKAVDSPSYVVPVDLEGKITLKNNKKPMKKEVEKENAELNKQIAEMPN